MTLTEASARLYSLINMDHKGLDKEDIEALEIVSEFIDYHQAIYRIVSEKDEG